MASSVMNTEEKYVELLETFGNDLTVVNAARVSFAKESKEMTNGDRKLIRYLAKHNHITPFFHPQVRFRIKMPIFVAREWFRHTIGFARNEVSRRYVDFEPECWLPSVDGIRERDPKLKQGSKETAVDNAGDVYSKMKDCMDYAVKAYNELIEAKVAPEIARAVLPQSMYTEFIETGSLYAYARLCNLRLDPSAQAEIRRYAELIADSLRDAFPESWVALEENFKSTVQEKKEQQSTFEQISNDRIRIKKSDGSFQEYISMRTIEKERDIQSREVSSYWGC
jgi:thymidylate synthase (FAD)